MRKVGEIDGTGKLPSGSAAEYHIEVWQDPGGWKKGNGTLSADVSELIQAFKPTTVTCQ